MSCEIFLEAGEWQKAERETYKIMRKAAKVGWFGELNSKNINS
ncbi:hypothetical protein [Okeania sp. SIO2C9]|nr:hypothetical protein [Okeania sp. SIO2C9]